MVSDAANCDKKEESLARATDNQLFTHSRLKLRFQHYLWELPFSTTENNFLTESSTCAAFAHRLERMLKHTKSNATTLLLQSLMSHALPVGSSMQDLLFLLFSSLLLLHDFQI